MFFWVLEVWGRVLRGKVLLFYVSFGFEWSLEDEIMMFILGWE